MTDEAERPGASGAWPADGGRSGRSRHGDQGGLRPGRAHTALPGWREAADMPDWGEAADVPDWREAAYLAGWREAAEAALYGPGGFYLRPEGPAGHFRTSVHASQLFAEAVARLLCRVDEALGHPAELAFVDMGAGRGELVHGVLASLPAEVATRTRGYAVERARTHPVGGAGAGPTAGTEAGPTAGTEVGSTAGTEAGPTAGTEVGSRAGAGDIVWCTAPPQGVTGLLFANEWLDNVPLDVVETGPDGVPRRVLVRADGTEVLGGPLAEGPDTRWLRRWWPGTARPGLRAEIGRPRDEAWAAAVGTLRAGYAVAADYGHLRASRPAYGTLTGFRTGREVTPVPDGSCDITAHVALDACAAAGAERVAAAAERPGNRPGTGTGCPTGEPEPAGPRLVSQRAALHALGVTGERPPLALATSDPTAYVRALAAASEAAELTAPEGLGGFGWLLQPVGIGHPEGLPEGTPLGAPPGTGPGTPAGAGSAPGSPVG